MDISNEMKQQLLDEVAEAFSTEPIPDHAVTVMEMVAELKRKGAPRSRSTVERMLNDKVQNHGWTRAYDGKRYKYWRVDD